MLWFEELVGFQEESPAQVRANLSLSGTKLTSNVNGRSFEVGKLEIPTLNDLRIRSRECEVPKGQLTLKEVVADAQWLHTEPQCAGALIQAASQFNLLEMVAPSVTPEAGVGIYDHDPTQGPACAIAAGAGTIYRNYFVEVNGQIGQTEDNQIDCLHEVGKFLGNKNNRLWQMRNGYALATREGLEKISQDLQSFNESTLEDLRGLLRVGIQWNTEVTFQNCGHLVTQVYCSALPVRYSRLPIALWADFAQMVLEATYEATLAAAKLNFAQTGNNRVYLTLVGGGAFGNEAVWIFNAMKRALDLYHDVPLEVNIVSYRRSSEAVRHFVESY